MRTQHPVILLTALTGTALALLAWAATRESIIQGSGESDLMRAMAGIAILNLAASIPHTGWNTAFEISRATPAVLSGIAIAAYLGIARTPPGIAPELLAGLALAPTACGALNLTLWARSTRERKE